MALPSPIAVVDPPSAAASHRGAVPAVRLEGLTKTFAKGQGKHRIRVNHLIAGWTMTEKQKRMWLDAAGEKAIAEGQCLPDKVQPSDVAAMALFLGADDSRMITSQDFVVDGGWV